MTTLDTAPGAQLGASPAQYRIALPVGTFLLNANQRLHHRPAAQHVKTIREAACLVARQQRIPHMELAHVTYLVHPATAARRRDPGNWSPSAKAAIDGMVDAGVLDDDNSTRLLGPDPRLGAPVKGSQLVLVITDLSTAPAWLLRVLDPTRQLALTGEAA